MSQKKELKLRDFSKNSENPFVEKAIEEIKIVKKTQAIRSRNKSEIQMIVSDHGEVEGYTQFLRFIEVDEQQFAKVYLSQFQAFWELPKQSIRVFGYIIQQLKPSKDSFMFYIDKCMFYTGYKSKTQIYEGLTALLENNIIARGQTEYEYFINPMIAFNGDRVTFAQTYIKKKKGNSNAVDPMQTNLLDQIAEIKGE